MIYFTLDENNRLVSASKHFHCGENEISKAAPENFNLENMKDWKYINEQFIYDPIEVSEPENQSCNLQETIDSLIDTNNMLIECILQMSEQLYGE